MLNISGMFAQDLAKMPYNWYSMQNGPYDGGRDILGDNKDLVIVSDEILISEFSEDFLNDKIRGRLSPRFVDSFVRYFPPCSDSLFDFFQTITVKKNEFSNVIKLLKDKVPQDIFTNARLFVDELLPNIFMHTREDDGTVSLWISGDGVVKISIRDTSGLLKVPNIVSSLGEVNRDQSDKNNHDSVATGGHGLRLVLNFSSFVYFCIIPDKLSSVTGFFIPGYKGCGFIIENREDVINAY
ncbi:MAG: hypothetical protein JXA66_00685 [Oligoflexia bacterium]|nr:hypothetical protein [Oligoflexia bacterium]